MNSNMYPTLSDAERRWFLALDSAHGIVHFGLDSECTGRETTNMLAGTPVVRWIGTEPTNTDWSVRSPDRWQCELSGADGSRLIWTVERDIDDLVMSFANNGPTTVDELTLSFPIDALVAVSVLLPASVDADRCGRPPWLLVAADLGHLRICPEPATMAWHAVNRGTRRGATKHCPSEGVDPHLCGDEWRNATGQTDDYTPSTLDLRFILDDRLGQKETVALRFSPTALTMPDGIGADIWRRIRRPLLNHWQPCGDWAGRDLTWLLANNVLSDPASCSLWFYGEPMLFWHEPVPGIDLRSLLRLSLDHWLDHGVSHHGHVNAFGRMFDLYVFTGAVLVIAAWDYWTVSGDHAWLSGKIERLHRVADYLVRRDTDNDGLIESIHSGNAGTLRDPDRADVWFEMMNFGGKNAWTNLLVYRAFLCLAEMLDSLGQESGASWYRMNAKRLRETFRTQMMGENGWFVSWVSEDGEVHDYCHTFINGMAVAYNIVDPNEGRPILSRVVAQSHRIGFTRWDLGVPANLLPCRQADMIGPRIGIDGKPVNDNFAWPEGLTEHAAFGHRYPNGTIHPTLVWPYLLGLQIAGLDAEADRILEAMISSAEAGVFQNGLVNAGYGGAEHFTIDGRTCGYEGFLPESWNFLMAAFTRDPELRTRLLGPVA